MTRARSRFDGGLVDSVEGLFVQGRSSTHPSLGTSLMGSWPRYFRIGGIEAILATMPFASRSFAKRRSSSYSHFTCRLGVLCRRYMTIQEISPSLRRYRFTKVVYNPRITYDTWLCKPVPTISQIRLHCEASSNGLERH